MLVVASGIARLDNQKTKAAFGGRPRMLGAEETLTLTGHPVGGVCPFGLATPLPVYLDVSLQGFRNDPPRRRIAQHLGQSDSRAARLARRKRAGSTLPNAGLNGRPSPSSTFRAWQSAMAARAALDGVASPCPPASSSPWSGRRARARRPCSRSINRLVEPDEGTVRIDGRRCARRCRPRQLRRGIGYVFQEHRPVPAPERRREYRHRAAARAGPARAPARAELLELVALAAGLARRATRARCPAASSSGSASPGRSRRGRS